MSNRSRRRLLHEWRTRAIVRAGDSPPDSIESIEEWNRWHRDAFRFIQRAPLRLPNNDRTDGGLAYIQAHNKGAPFNPLRDAIPERPRHLAGCGNRNNPQVLWEKTQSAILGALDYLKPAKTIKRHRFDWVMWQSRRTCPEHPNPPKRQCDGEMAEPCLINSADFPASFYRDLYRALRQVRTGYSALTRYGRRGNPWGLPDHGDVARSLLQVDAPITDPQLYALLTLAASCGALDNLLELSNDPEQSPRWELDYIAGLIQDAERWLAEAYRLKQSDAKQAATRSEADTEKAAIRDAWAEDSHRKTSAKGGEAPKGSAGVRLLALALREEKPSVSAETLFNTALSRAGDRKKPLYADAYIITTNAEAKQLFSTDPDGKPDGLPVGLSGWRKIAPPRRAKKS